MVNLRLLCENVLEPSAESIDTCFYPFLGVGSEGEGALEDRQEDKDEDREAQPSAGQYRIQFHGETVVRIISAMDDGFLKGSCHETSSGLSYQVFGRLSEFLFQSVVYLSGDLQNLFRIRKGVDVGQDVVLVLQKADGDITFREMLPMVVTFVDSLRNQGYRLLDILSVRHADLAFIGLAVAFRNLAEQGHLRLAVILVADDHRHAEHPRKLSDVKGVAGRGEAGVVPDGKDDPDVHVVQFGDRIQCIFQPHRIHYVKDDVRGCLQDG